MTDLAIRGDPWQTTRPAARRPGSRLHFATVLLLLVLMGPGAPGVCVIHCALLEGLALAPGGSAAGLAHLHHHALIALLETAPVAPGDIPADHLVAQAAIPGSLSAGMTTLPDQPLQSMPQPFQEMAGPPTPLLHGGGLVMEWRALAPLRPIPVFLAPILRPPISRA